MGSVSEDAVQEALAEVLDLEYMPLDAKRIDRRAFEYLPTEFMKSRGCCGVKLDEGRLTLGMVDPADVFLLDEVKRRINAKSVDVVVVCQMHINATIEAGAAQNSEGEKFDEIIKDMGEEELEICPRRKR